jgi:Ser/Thr protein kinase RdoA (MazF antagonist)
LFSDGNKTFFLKRYNTTDTNRIHDIVTTYERFYQRGIPVIRPIQNRLGEFCFFLDDAWWGVFPFVEGIIRPSEALTTEDLQALGALLGDIHRVGQSSRREDIQPIALWNKDVFTSEQHLLEYTYHRDAAPREAASLAFQNIVIQKQFLDEHADFIERPQPQNDCLIHGDFTHNNVFFQAEGGIKATFDLDKTCVAPRAYEVARSTLIICFDRAWDDASFEQARVFLQAYLSTHPMAFEEFRAGLHMYIANYMHMTWLERKVILDRSARHERILRSSHVRLTHLATEFSTLAERLFPQ